MHDLLTSGRYNEILDYSSTILAKDPLNLKALKYRAYALYFLGRYDEAISFYDKAMRLSQRVHQPMQENQERLKNWEDLYKLDIITN